MDAAPAAGTPRLLFKGRDRLTACAADVPALILRDAFGAAAEDARRLVLFEHNAVIVHIYFQRGVIMSMLAQRGMPRRAPELWMADSGCGYLLQCSPELWMRDGIVEVSDIIPFGYLDGEEGK